MLSDEQWENILTQDARAYINRYYARYPKSRFKDDEIYTAWLNDLEIRERGGGFRDPNAAHPRVEAKTFKERDAPDGEWSVDSVLAELKSTGKGNRDKSFGPFAKMLEDLERKTMRLPEGAAKQAKTMVRDQLRADVSEIVGTRAIGDLTEDYLRHELKLRSKERIFEGLHAQTRSRGFDFLESHKEFLELTKSLNPSDRGNMMERWYRVVYGSGAKKHVRISRDFPSGSKQRVSDLFEVTTTRAGKQQGVIKELKSTEQEIKPSDSRFWEQFRDYLSLHREEVDGVPVEKLTYVFTSPEGAWKNAAAMERMFKLASKRKVPLAIEVFDAAGQRHVIRKRSQIVQVMGEVFGVPR